MDRMKDILEKMAKQNAASPSAPERRTPPIQTKTTRSTRKPARTRHAEPSSNSTDSGAAHPTPEATNNASPTEPEKTQTHGNDVPSPVKRLRAVPRLQEYPAADVQMPPIRESSSRTLDMDRILELPARRRDADVLPLPSRVTGTPSPSGASLPRVEAIRALTPRASNTDTAAPGANSSGLEPIGDSMRGFLERLAERRRQRALSGDLTSGGQIMAPPQPPVCPFCGGAGYVRLDVPVGHPSFGQPVPCKCKERELEERHRLEEERRLLELDRFFSLKPFSDKTFATFNPNAVGVAEAYKAARKFAEDPVGAQNRWLVLLGAPGTGKTHLAAAIANQRLTAGSSVFFAVVPDLLDHLRSAFAPSSEVPYNEMFETIREVEMLILDDLGAQNSTAWATEKLFQLINHRYNYRMPTVITTNVQAFQRLDERIASRLSDPTLARSILIETSSRRPRMTPKSTPRW